jgi:tetratricopeptide (TPR) repeat protein
MKVRLIPLFTVLLLQSTVIVQCGRVDADREANRLFVEAYQHTSVALQSEQHDPAEAYAHYRQALEKIESIISNYPNTSVAVDVAQHRTRIGDITIGDLRSKVPRFAARADALENFHKLTLYLIDFEDQKERALRRLTYASILKGHGQDDLHDELISQVRRQADRHWDRQVIDRIYFELARHHASLAQWDSSLQLVDRLQDRQYLYEALDHLLVEGFLKDRSDRGYLDVTGYLDYLDPVNRIRLTGRLCGDLIAAGQRAQAMAILQEGLPGPGDNDNLDYINALSQMASILSEHGEIDASRSIIEQIGQMDSNYADFSLRDLSIAVARQGDLQAALHIAEAFERAYFRNTAFAGISLELARRDSIAQALGLLNQIPDNLDEKTESLITLAGMGFEDGSLVDSLLQAAVPRIQDLDSPVARANASIRLADIHITHDRRSLAAQAMEQAEQHTSLVSDPENINLLLSDIVRMWISLGRPDRALDIATRYRMDHPSFKKEMPGLFAFAIQRGFHDFARTLAGMTDDRPFYLHMLITEYLHQGVISQPSELAYEIRNYYWRSRALALLSMKLREKVNVATAERAATDVLLTIQRIRDRSEKQQALYHAASLLSAGGINLDQDRRPLVIDLINQIDN